MAKKRASATNKSQAIRDEFETQGADARPKDIIAALAAKGIEVTAAHVSNVKSALLGGKTMRRNGRGEVDIDDLMRAKELADKLGGIQRAKQALDALAKLR